MRLFPSLGQPDVTFVVVDDRELGLLREALRKPRGASAEAKELARDIRRAIKKAKR